MILFKSFLKINLRQYCPVKKGDDRSTCNAVLHTKRSSSDIVAVTVMVKSFRVTKTQRNCTIMQVDLRARRRMP